MAAQRSTNFYRERCYSRRADLYQKRYPGFDVERFMDAMKKKSVGSLRRVLNHLIKAANHSQRQARKWARLATVDW